MSLRVLVSLNFKYKLSENAGFVDSLEEFETKATFVSKLKADKGFGAIGKVSLQTAQVLSVQFSAISERTK